MLHMMFKLGQCAEQNWTKLRGFGYLAKVITGVTFKDGIEASTKTRSPHDHNISNTRFDNNSQSAEGDGLASGDVGYFVHGGTTVINAITERKGVKTALVTTRGFRDVLEIGRGNRPDLYNLKFRSPEPYVERHLRLEVSERIDADGSIHQPINLADVDDVAERLAQEQVEAVAVVFLNAYSNPEHETACAQRLAARLPGVTVCAGHEVSNLWREFERTSTAVLNAYVKPIISRYFAQLGAKLNAAAIQCAHYAMLSNGGIASFDQAAAAPLNLVESGPSGGVAGAARIGDILDEPNTLALDVGGTTAKCSVIVGGAPRISSDYRMQWDRLNPGYPVQIPVVDIVEIGAGGGSIARIDNFGSLTVGPDSAGAVPGPVCYGQGGTEPTVTDAKLIVGVIDENDFAEGRIALDKASARAAITALGRTLGLDCEATAQAIIDLAEANMINALKLVTIQRGHDPRDFSLVVSGGAGPLFAASLGRELGVKRTIIPQHAGLFSAWGMLAAKPRVDLRRTWFKALTDDAIAPLQSEISALRQSSIDYFGKDDAAGLDFSVSLQMRYQGQEHSVSTSIHGAVAADTIAEQFHRAHKMSYSFALPDAAIEITGLHLVAVLDSPVIEVPNITTDDMTLDAAVVSVQQVFLGHGRAWRACNVYQRDRLPIDSGITGPALIREPTCTTQILDGQAAHRDRWGLLTIRETGDGR